MAQLPVAFNAYAVDPAQPVQMLPLSGPEGHKVIITNSEFKAAKSGGQNGYLELMLQVVEGQHQGEVGAYRLNLYNDNPVTVDIASHQLSALCYVTKQMQISDSAQLHNIPFRAIVTMQKKKQESDPDYTQVSGVLDINGNKPDKNMANGPAATQPGPAFGQSQPTGRPAPWGAPAPGQGAPAPVQEGGPAWGPGANQPTQSQPTPTMPWAKQ